MASTNGLRMDGEVIGCFGEIAGFDINASFLPGSCAAARSFALP